MSAATTRHQKIRRDAIFPEIDCNHLIKSAADKRDQLYVTGSNDIGYATGYSTANECINFKFG